MEAALLVVADSIDGSKQWYTPTEKQPQETSMQLCAGVRRLLRDKLPVLYSTPHLLPMVSVGEASPEHNDPAHGTRVPLIRVRSIQWAIMPTAVSICYMISVGDVEDVMFGDRCDFSAQDVTCPHSAVCLKFSVAFEQEIDGVQWPASLQEQTFIGHFNHAKGGVTWPSTLNWVVVSDDFEHSTVGITSLYFRVSNRGILMLCML